MKPIALDAMGGDYMPEAAIEGAAMAVKHGIPVVLVGNESILRQGLAAAGESLPICHAEDVISMTDQASDVRKRKNSSIMKAMNLVKTASASACVSMGNSGATMAAGLFVLGRIKGIERPAIVANIPTREGFVALIDAGANLECRPSYLQQFAVMGSIYAQVFYQKASPKVGLMSIGEEEGKGNDLVQGAYELLQKTANINFYGNIEGRDLLTGKTDVAVTDGFTGNVVLKLAEGEAREIMSWIREGLQGGNLLVKLGAALVRPALKRIALRMDPSEYGAQPLLGVKGFALIGHGSAKARAVYNAIKTAKMSVEADLVTKIEQGVAALAVKEKAL